MGLERGKEREDNKYTYNDVMKDIQAGKLDKVRSMGFGAVIETMLGNKNANANIDGQIKDGKEKEDSFLDKMEGFFKDLGEKSPFSNLNQKGLFAVGSVVNEVLKTGEDKELSFSNGDNIIFGKEDGQVKAFGNDGNELTFGAVLDTSSKGVGVFEQTQTKGIDNLIDNFKTVEQGAEEIDRSGGGIFAKLAQMMGLDGSQQAK